MLFSADINTTILDAKPILYQKLLEQVSQNRHMTEDVLLERTLLQELISLKEVPLNAPKNFSTLYDTNGYHQLFLYYINNIETVIDLQHRLEKNLDKIETIETAVEQFDQNDTRLFSFELQDAYYHKKVALYQDAITTIHKRISDLTQEIEKSLGNITFDIQQLQENAKEEETLLLKYQNQINKLLVLNEQAEFVNDTRKVETLNKKLNNIRGIYTAQAKEFLSTQFLIFSAYLKQKDEKVFVLEKNISTSSIKTNILTEKEVDRYLLPLLLSLEKRYMGEFKTLTSSSEQELKDAMYQSWTFVNTPVLTINNTSISILKLVLSLLIFSLGFVFGSFYKRKINKLASNKRSFTLSTRIILANMGYYIIVTISFFIALNVLGVKLSSIALVAGALSVGIGFGLQNIVSNFVSGLILMFERSVKIGDYIEVDEHTKGYVIDIRMRATTINTNENIDIIIPNQNFIQNNVINWTMNDKLRRFSIPFGVAYGTDVHKVIEIVKRTILDSDYKDDIVDNSVRQTNVIMTEMADSSVNFELLVWIKGDKMHKPKRTASEFLILIYDALYDNDIEIPFPQQDLHIRSIDASIPIMNLKGE